MFDGLLHIYLFYRLLTLHMTSHSHLNEMAKNVCWGSYIRTGVIWVTFLETSVHIKCWVGSIQPKSICHLFLFRGVKRYLRAVLTMWVSQSRDDWQSHKSGGGAMQISKDGANSPLRKELSHTRPTHQTIRISSREDSILCCLLNSVSWFNLLCYFAIFA